MPSAAPLWLELPLMVAVVAAAGAALLARSLVVACVDLFVAAAAASALLVALGSPEGGVALAVVVGAWTPLLILAALALSKRAIGPARRPWLSLGGGALAAPAFAAIGALAAPASAALRQPHSFAVWLAPLMFVAALACVGLLGLGERGVFEAEREP